MYIILPYPLKTEMGENHEKTIYYNKKYTKITILGFIRKTYTINLSILDQEPRMYN